MQSSYCAEQTLVVIMSYSVRLIIINKAQVSANYRLNPQSFIVEAG